MKFISSFTIIILFLLQSISIAQSTIKFEGTVIDADSKKPIPLASIGLPKLNIGTASRMDGSFLLNLSREFKKDTLQISAVGYHTKKYPIHSFEDDNNITVYLVPRTYQMDEITVTDRERKTKWIGKMISPILSASLGIWTHPDRLGAAFAFKVKWKKQLPLQILYSRTFVERNTHSPVHIRCGLAEVDPNTGLPSHEFHPQTIDITTTTQKDWATCDFRNQNLYVDAEEFFVVFEWLTPQDERIIPMIATTPFFKSDTYYRHHALAEWKKSSTDLIYSVKVAY